MMRLWCFFAMTAALAAPPVVSSLRPHGGQRGKTVQATLRGYSLSLGASVFSDIPGTVIPGAVSGDQTSMALTLTIRADAAPGIYSIRVRSTSGTSNAVRFSVGAGAEFEEAPAPSTPQRIRAIPATVNGTLQGDEVDHYLVYGKGGERRVLELEALRLGSPAGLDMRVLNAQGRLIGQGKPLANGEGDVDFTAVFPAEGWYTVEVRPRSGPAPAGSFYRLKMGQGRPGVPQDIKIP